MPHLGGPGRVSFRLKPQVRRKRFNMPAPRASASRSYAWQGRSDQGRFYRKYRWPQLSKNRMLARGSASKRNFAAFTSTWPLLQGRQHRAPLPLPRPPTIETSTSPKHNYKRLVQSVFSTSGDAYRLQPALQWSSYVLARYEMVLLTRPALASDNFNLPRKITMHPPPLSSWRRLLREKGQVNQRGVLPGRTVDML